MKKLKQLPKNEQNLIISFEDISKQYQSYLIVKNGYYYPYNCCIEDLGWGCAWRSIQMILSSFKIDYTFEKLFMQYASKKKLMEIAIEKNILKGDEVQILKDMKWAPQEIPNNWAEPFISHLICRNLGLNSQIYLLNGYPEAFAPQIVFKEIINFSTFWKYVKNNFQAPIMIDDGQLNLTIIGSKQQSPNDLHIICADPHITTNKKQKSTGIYEIILDSQGNQKSSKMKQQQKQNLLYNSYSKIEFKNKFWMISIIEQL